MKSNHNLFEVESGFFNALAHPARIEILELLRDGEACVCHIQAMLDQRQAYISQHLNVLRNAGLVTSRKDGLRVYYKLSHPGLLEILDKAKVYLQTVEKRQPGRTDQSDLAKKKQFCNCPQCMGDAEPRSSNGIEVEYA